MKNTINRTNAGRLKKFSELDKQDIIANYNRGMDIQDLAKKYKCSENSIRHCVVEMQLRKQEELKEKLDIKTDFSSVEKEIEYLKCELDFQHAVSREKDEAIGNYLDTIQEKDSQIFELEKELGLMKSRLAIMNQNIKITDIAKEKSDELNQEYEKALQELYQTLKMQNLCNKKDGPTIKLIHKVCSLIQQLCVDKDNLQKELDEIESMQDSDLLDKDIDIHNMDMLCDSWIDKYVALEAEFQETQEQLFNSAEWINTLNEKIQAQTNQLEYLEESFKNQIIEKHELEKELEIVTDRFNDLVGLGCNACCCED